MAEEVQLAVEGGLLDNLFVAMIAAKGFAMHHEAAGRRHGEPAHVELRVGLTGTEELPFAAFAVGVGYPDFDPGVVVVAVRPTGCVALAGGDAHGAEGSDGKGALLTAAAQGGAHGGKGCRGAAVGSTVGHMLVAPVVDLEGGLLHGETFDAVFQLAVEGHAGGIEVFIIDAIDENEMAEDVFGDEFSPGHGIAGSEGIAHLLKVEVGGVVGEVAIRHVGVKELHGLALGTAEGV